MKWNIEKRKLSDLKPAVYNPRTITELGKKRLQEDLDEFGNMSHIIINKDGTIISGHQRYHIFFESHGADHEIDVMVPQEKLEKKKEKQANLILNSHRGQWDLGKLDELQLPKNILIDLGIPIKEERSDIQTPLAYYGGKQTKAGKICALFRPHNFYIEPFTGGGAIFWHKPLVEYNILNDTNKGVYSFWKFLKESPVKLKKAILEKALMHEDFYRESIEIYKKGEVSIENAVATFYLTFCGMGNSIQSFVLRREKPRRMEFIASQINIYAEKLQKSHIYNRDALSLIDLHTRRSDALFFIDPPYVDCNMGHYNNYSAQDFESLLKKLETINGDFVLTVGDTEICDKYVKKNNWTQIKEDTRAKTSTKGKHFVETIVLNYEPEQVSESHDE